MNDIWDKPSPQHNHPLAYWPASGVKPEGECERCDEWWRWHNKVELNPTPATLVEKKRRGRPKKDDATGAS